jgi:hypothetical protein
MLSGGDRARGDREGREGASPIGTNLKTCFGTCREQKAMRDRRYGMARRLAQRLAVAAISHRLCAPHASYPLSSRLWGQAPRLHNGVEMSHVPCRDAVV